VLASGACLRAQACCSLHVAAPAARERSLCTRPLETNENSAYPEPMTIPSYRNTQVTVNGS